MSAHIALKVVGQNSADPPDFAVQALILRVGVGLPTPFDHDSPQGRSFTDLGLRKHALLDASL
jgi:hypothetical protein